jgi:hypothetical protein
MLAAVFACEQCNASPELVAAGKSQLSVVRHRDDCPLLQQRIRERWAPPAPERLPATPPPSRYDKRRHRASRTYVG